MGRLDMNTCQTSINTDILYSTLVIPILGTKYLRSPQWFTYRTDLSGEVRQTKQRISQIRMVDRLLKLS